MLNGRPFLIAINKSIDALGGPSACSAFMLTQQGRAGARPSRHVRRCLIFFYMMGRAFTPFFSGSFWGTNYSIWGSIFEVDQHEPISPTRPRRSPPLQKSAVSSLLLKWTIFSIIYDAIMKVVLDMNVIISCLKSRNGYSFDLLPIKE